MSYQLSQPLQMTDEQVQEYIAQVYLLIENRKKAGALLSVFDLIAAGGLTLFLAGRQDRIPAAWIFGGVREGMLPDGLLDKAYQLDREIPNATDALESLRLMMNTIDDIRQQAKGMERKMRAAIAGAEKTVALAEEISKI